MSIPSVKTLLESGVHFGHQTSRWNPKMKQFIFGRKNLIHIIDLRSTLRGLIRASNLLKNIAARGQYILFVGTKRQARSVILEEAVSCDMPYVSDRWLGGTLTNFLTIRSRLKRLDELEELEESGRMSLYSKKEISRFRRELQKLKRNLGGIREMEKLPGALLVVDPSREDIAVKEAKILGIPVIGLVDTDTDPELIDIVIPCNDDAFRSVKIILSRFTESILEGKAVWEENRGIIEKKAKTEARLLAEASKQRRAQKRDDKPRRRAPSRAKKAGTKAEPAAEKQQVTPAPQANAESKPKEEIEKPQPVPNESAEPAETSSNAKQDEEAK